MKKFFTLAVILLLSIENCAAADVVPDDDSVPYMPTPQTQPQNNDAPKKNQSSKRSVRKAPVKRPVKKKTTAKKKTTSAKNNAAKPKKPSSLEQGIALMKQERYEAARPYLQKAIQEDRNNAAAWYWYGKYHEMTGAFNQAQYFYTKAINTDPTFDPLSRVVNYPEDGEKVALWDPKRPARVYPVNTGDKTASTIPAGSAQSRKLPSRPAGDPELPKVPVYTPPEPGADPMDGDSWRPAIYVPPSANQNMNIPDADEVKNQRPVYNPPRASKKNTISKKIDVQEIQEPVTEEIKEPEITEPDQNEAGYKVIEIDLDENNTQKITEQPKQEIKQTAQRVQPQETTDEYTIIKGGNIFYTPEQSQTAAKNVTTANTENKQAVQTQKTSSTKQTAKKSTAVTKKSTARKKTTTAAAQNTQPTQPAATSQDIKPKTIQQPVQTKTQPEIKQPVQQKKEPVKTQPAPVKKSEQPKKNNAPKNSNLEKNNEQPQNQDNNQEAMPPVGQFSADPGTLDDKPMPPVGQ